MRWAHTAVIAGLVVVLGCRHARHDAARDTDASTRHKDTAVSPPAGLPDPHLPDGMKGFSGTLAGVVKRVGDLGFVLHVTQVVNTWKKNEAKEPKSAVGRDLLVNVQWEKGEGDPWHPVPNHVRWVGTLHEGDDLRIEVRNDEGERLHILELSKEQRGATEP